MPRITISIPHDLQHRLADPRIRKSINVSRTCQDALRREVSRLLDLPLDLERIERTLQRLRQERTQVQSRWFQAGAAAAREWVEHEAGFARLRELGSLSIQARIRALRTAPSPELASALERQRAGEGFDEASFLQGWATALGLLWEALQEKI
jgi:hypothetical protein